MARWQGRLERKQGFLGRIVDIGAELFAISADLRPGGDGLDRWRRDRARRDRVRARRPVLHPGPAARRGTVRPAVEQQRCRRLGQLAKRILAGSYTWLEDGVIDPSIPGPWIAAVELGPSKAENVHRTIG